MKSVFATIALLWSVISGMFGDNKNLDETNEWYYYHLGEYYYVIGPTEPSGAEFCFMETNASYCYYRLIALFTPPSMIHEDNPLYNFEPWSSPGTVHIDEMGIDKNLLKKEVCKAK